MQQHDLGEQSPGRTFGMGRPVREICGALQKITGNKLGEEELFHSFLEGGKSQQELQRSYFYQIAHRWAGWWRTNWNSFVEDPALAEIRLPDFALVKSETKGFPTGPNAKETSGHSGVVIGAVEEGGGCFLDLDTSRRPSREAALRVLGEADFTTESVSSWAQRQGVDLIGTKYTSNDTGKAYYALRGVGVQAWEVSADRWDSIDEELRCTEPLKLGRKVEDMLLHYDSDKAAYVPNKQATFLFITQEGTPGIMRIVSQAAWPRNGVKIEYKTFYLESDK